MKCLEMQKKKAKVWQTDRQTDRRTDGRYLYRVYATKNYYDFYGTMIIALQFRRHSPNMIYYFVITHLPLLVVRLQCQSEPRCTRFLVQTFWKENRWAVGVDLGTDVFYVVCLFIILVPWQQVFVAIRQTNRKSPSRGIMSKTIATCRRRWFNSASFTPKSTYYWKASKKNLTWGNAT